MDMQNRSDPQPIPMRRNIATPTIPNRNDNVIDMNIVRSDKADEQHKTIVSEVITGPIRSPTIASSSDNGDQYDRPNGFYRLGNGDGNRNGDGGDGPDRDDSGIGITAGHFNNYNRM